MEMSHLPKLSPKLLILCAAFCFALNQGTSSAQTTLISPTVNDGSFESITVKTLFTATASATTGVPFWGYTGFTTTGVASTATDSGADIGGNATQQGTKGGFFKSTDSIAFNLVTSYTINTGDRFSLTWYAFSSGSVLSSQAVNLFSQTAVNGAGAYSYDANSLRLVSTTVGQAGFGLSQAAFTQYTLTGVATAADAGKIIGFTFGNAGEPTNNVNNNFVTADNFVLSVTPVPEPSTYAFLGAGVVGLGLMLRARRRA